ncbi:MAG: hypothetical protein SW833_26715 [Cyanobacteriota bacterium]|nr:hypothetical protein [Cyanobacteriota bacterium]
MPTTDEQRIRRIQEKSSRALVKINDAFVKITGLTLHDSYGRNRLKLSQFERARVMSGVKVWWAR